MRWCWHGAAALLGALTACSFPADYEGTRYQCVQPGPGECPDGYECRDGFCEASQGGPDGGGGSFTDAGDGPPDGSTVGGVDGGDDPPCESVASAAGFASPAAWETVKAEKGCQIIFTDGTVAMQNLDGPISDCASQSRGQYWLNERTWVEVLDGNFGIPSPGFGLVIGKQTFLWRNTPDGLLVFERDEEGFEDVYDGFDYNPVDDRYWAFTPGIGDVIEMQTSPDAVNWTTLTDFRPIDDPRETCVTYEISIVEGDEKPSIVVFKSLNDVSR